MQLIQKMKEETQSGEKESLLNISKWLAKTTLDAIGQSQTSLSCLCICTDLYSSGAFDYYFGALDGAQASNELVRVFNNLL